MCPTSHSFGAYRVLYQAAGEEPKLIMFAPEVDGEPCMKETPSRYVATTTRERKVCITWAPVRGPGVSAFACPPLRSEC